jgi:hypothetical protein
LICPHCKEEGTIARVFNYDDERVTCKFGHIQRASNAVPTVELAKTEARRSHVPIVAYSAFGLAAIDLLLRLL